MEELCSGSWWDAALEIPDGVPALENWWERWDALDVITISSKPFTPLVIERSVWKLGACKLTERVSQGCLTSVTCAHPLCYHAWQCSRQWIPSPRHNKAKSAPMRTALPGWNVRRLDKSIPHITLRQARRRSFHRGGYPIKAELLSASDDGQRPEVSRSDDRACLLHTFCHSSVTWKYYLYLQLYCFSRGRGRACFLSNEKKKINFSCKLLCNAFNN